MQVCIHTRKWTRLNANDQREPGDNPKYLQVYQQAYCLTLGEKKIANNFRTSIFHQHTTFFFFACKTRLPQLQRACRAQSQQKASNAPSPEHKPTDQGVGLKVRQLATQRGQKQLLQAMPFNQPTHRILQQDKSSFPFTSLHKEPSSRNDVSPLPALP